MSKYLDKLKRILVLTPDAIGSTYFQRSLTVYLNYHGHPTKNYHDLCNLTLDLPFLIKTLSTNTTSTIARCSPYRSLEFGNNTKKYLKFCNYFFEDIYIIDRCSFESVLSYCNTHQSTKKTSLNVYTKYDYLLDKNKTSYTIDNSTFIESLKYFENFYVWADKYFPKYKKIKHLDLINDPDTFFKNEFNISSDKELSLKEYNKFNTLRIRNGDLSRYSTTDLLKFIDITDYIDFLNLQELLIHRNKFPLKKITLSEKIKDISNFTELLDTYNNYPSNHFEKITLQQINNRAMLEDNLWTI
jgi:hypothetical protein